MVVTYGPCAGSSWNRNPMGVDASVALNNWMTYWNNRSVFWVWHVALEHRYSTPVQLSRLTVVHDVIVQSMSNKVPAHFWCLSSVTAAAVAAAAVAAAAIPDAVETQRA